jgi:hypothetical protein
VLADGGGLPAVALGQPPRLPYFSMNFLACVSLEGLVLGEALRLIDSQISIFGQHFQTS